MLLNDVHILQTTNRDCSGRLKQDIAIVEIYFDSMYATVLKQDVKTTFSDKLCNIGKITNMHVI